MKELLGQLADTTSRAIKKRAELLDEIRVELKSHTTIEEEIFYPAFRTAGNKSDDDLVLPDLFSTPVDSEKFSGRTKVLKELVTHHADEEEAEMFVRA